MHRRAAQGRPAAPARCCRADQHEPGQLPVYRARQQPVARSVARAGHSPHSTGRVQRRAVDGAVRCRRRFFRATGRHRPHSRPAHGRLLRGAPRGDARGHRPVAAGGGAGAPGVAGGWVVPRRQQPQLRWPVLVVWRAGGGGTGDSPACRNAAEEDPAPAGCRCLALRPARRSRAPVSRLSRRTAARQAVAARLRSCPPNWQRSRSSTSRPACVSWTWSAASPQTGSARPRTRPSSSCSP